MSFGRRALIAAGILVPVACSLVFCLRSTPASQRGDRSRARDALVAASAARGAPCAPRRASGPPVVAAPSPLASALERDGGSAVRARGRGETNAAKRPSFTGRVLGPGGVPLAGATLHAAGELDEATPVATTDEAGRFALERACAILEARARHHASERLATAGWRGELVFTLTRGEALHGQVVGREDGRPLPGARIEAAAGDWHGATTTDAVGAFVLEDAPADTAVSVRASWPGRVPVSVEASADPHGRDLVLALDRGATIHGRVVDPAGAPVVAEVFAFARPGPLEPQAAKSGRDGSFEIRGLPHGSRVALVALTPRLASQLDGLEWHGPGARSTIVVAPRGALVLEGLPPGVLELKPLEGPGELPSVVRRIDVDGTSHSRVARVMPATYRLWRDDSPVSAPFEVRAGETSTVQWGEIALQEAPRADTPPGAPLRVTVSDAEGRALAGAAVVIGTAQGDIAARTGVDGTIEVGDVPEGSVTVWAALPGRVLVQPVTVTLPPDGAPALTVALVLKSPGPAGRSPAKSNEGQPR